jgi:hypothetical protein
VRNKSYVSSSCSLIVWRRSFASAGLTMRAGESRHIQADGWCNRGKRRTRRRPQHALLHARAFYGLFAGIYNREPEDRSNSLVFRWKFFTSCLIIRSSMTSSEPPLGQVSKRAHSGRIQRRTVLGGRSPPSTCAQRFLPGLFLCSLQDQSQQICATTGTAFRYGPFPP